MDIVSQRTLKWKQAIRRCLQDIRRDLSAFLVVDIVIGIGVDAAILNNPHTIKVRWIDHKRRMRCVD